MTDQTDLQPDVEIYIQNLDKAQLLTWLASRFDGTESLELTDKKSQSFSLYKADNKIDVLLMNGVVSEGKGSRYSSIWFQSDKTGWADDRACARDAFKALDTEIRCNAAGWSEGEEQDPDLWWKINNEGEGEFLWRG